MLSQSAIDERRSLLHERVKNDCPERWYVGFVRPSAEFLTEKMLWSRGIFAYCPSYTFMQTVSHRRVLVRRAKPLFPRYLFIGLNGHFLYQNIAETPILGMLSRIEEDGDEEYRIPIIIRSEVVIELIEKELAGFLDYHDFNDVRVHDRVDVTIAEGITLKGMVVHLFKHRKVAVAVEMFGQKRLVKVGFAQLVRVF